MYVPDWIFTRFDLEIEKADTECHLEGEFDYMCADLETESLFRMPVVDEGSKIQ